MGKFQPSWAPKPKPTEEQESRDLLRQVVTLIGEGQQQSRAAAPPKTDAEMKAWTRRFLAKTEALVKAMANPDGTVTRTAATEPAYEAVLREGTELQIAQAAFCADAGNQSAEQR